MKRPLLAPLVPFHAAALFLREIALRTGLEPRRALQWPVISVGSISAGGAGKTPTILALAQLLKQSGILVDALSRGHGRKSTQAQAVNPDGDADRFGDEPLLIARETGVPVFVAKQRWDAGSLAEAHVIRNPVVHLLDDGMQHRQLKRSLEIALVSTADLNDHLIPAGNLREPLRALRRADVLAVQADDRHALGWINEKLPRCEVWTYTRSMRWPAEMPGRVLAFCGIARPEQFYAGLCNGGVEIVARQTFRDHHSYTEHDLVQLSAAFHRSSAQAFVTTAKDLARLGSRVEVLAQAAPVFSANIVIRFLDPAAIVRRVRGLFPGKGGNSSPTETSVEIQ